MRRQTRDLYRLNQIGCASVKHRMSARHCQYSYLFAGPAVARRGPADSIADESDSIVEHSARDKSANQLLIHSIVTSGNRAVGVARPRSSEK